MDNAWACAVMICHVMYHVHSIREWKTVTSSRMTTFHTTSRRDVCPSLSREFKLVGTSFLSVFPQRVTPASCARCPLDPMNRDPFVGQWASDRGSLF